MKSVYNKINQIFDNHWFLLLFIPIAAVFLLLYSSTTSPCYWSEGCDSVIFKTFGLAILQGKILYVDIFDNKGPILYFINALGQWIIPGRTGIFILQIVSLSISLVFLYKTSKLFISSTLSFIFLIISLGLLGVFFDYGNLSEEWNLPYLIIPLYLALSFFSKKNNSPHPNKYSLIYGLCFGMAFFIRPNDAVAQVGGLMVGLSLWLLYRKEYKKIFQTILFFTLGSLVIAIPIILWFGLNNALNDLYYALLQVNAKYTGGILNQFLSVFSKNKIRFFMFFVVLVVMIYNTSHKKILILLIPVLALTAVLIGSKGFLHYYIVVVPYFMLFFVFLCLQKNKSIIICSIAVLLASHIDTIRTARKLPITYYKQVSEVFKNGMKRPAYYEQTDKLLENIPEEERNNIWNYNLDFDSEMLWRKGIVQTNKVPLFLLYRVDENLKKEDDIIKKKPQYILFSEDHDKDSLDYEYILTNYEKVAEMSTTINSSIVLFKRKQINE